MGGRSIIIGGVCTLLLVACGGGASRQAEPLVRNRLPQEEGIVRSEPVAGEHVSSASGRRSSSQREPGGLRNRIIEGGAFGSGDGSFAFNDRVTRGLGASGKGTSADWRTWPLARWIVFAGNGTDPGVAGWGGLSGKPGAMPLGASQPARQDGANGGGPGTSGGAGKNGRSIVDPSSQGGDSGTSGGGAAGETGTGSGLAWPGGRLSGLNGGIRSVSFGNRARTGEYASYFREKYGMLPRLQAQLNTGSALRAGDGDAWRWGDSLSVLDSTSCGGAGYLIPGLPGGNDPLSFCIARSPFESQIRSTLNGW
ncbi:MAG: hypothetical protein PHW10_01235 [Candidatus Peribacteraceae bacterium]|nr:hypothetical protein [Candidatus Peribacteraceae bacterium]